MCFKRIYKNNINLCHKFDIPMCFKRIYKNNINLCHKFDILLCQISYIFFILCIFRYVYHLHCGLFVLGSCDEPFISYMFLPYSIFGIFISFVYICSLGCLYQICCIEHYSDEDFVY